MREKLLTTFTVCAGAAALFGCATNSPTKSTKPTETPAANKPASTQTNDATVQRLIGEGVALHDRQRYTEAVDRYQAALDLQADNVLARYEMAHTYAASGDYVNAHETARRGLDLDSPLVGSLYMMSALSLDNMGQPEASVNQFLAGIERFPNHYNLRLNLAITYKRANQVAAAVKSLEQTIPIDPAHPSGHFHLGYHYATSGQKLPALLAISRFLALERSGGRAAEASDWLKRLLESGVRKTADGRPLVVAPVPGAESDPFRKLANQLPLIMTLAQVAQQKSGGNETLEPYANALAVVIELLSKEDIDPSHSFAAAHYGPYFRALVEQEHVAAYTHVAVAGLDATAANAWFAGNEDELEKFERWSKSSRVSGSVAK